MTLMPCAVALIVFSTCAGASDDARSAAASAGSPDRAAEEAANTAEPIDQTQERTTSTRAADDAGDFLLEWQRGSGPLLHDQISVRGDGQLVWVAGAAPGDRASMRTATLRVSDAEVRSVREAVEAADFFALPPEITSGVSDGAQLTMRIRVGARTHRVRVEESFPPAIERIEAAVDALLTERRRAALADAPRAQPGDFDSSLVD